MFRSRITLALVVLVLVGVGLTRSRSAAASNKYLEIPSEGEATASPASTYGA